MRLLLILALLLAAPAAIAQEQPGFFQRLFGTDSAETDEQQGTMLEGLIESSLSGAGRTVTVTGFSGALSGRATLDRLTIADDQGVWLTLEDAVLDWSRAALFRGRLQVAELTASSIELARLPQGGGTEPPSPEATPFRLPELPVSVEIGRIQADEVRIGEPVLGVPAEVAVEGSLSLDSGNGAADLAIEKLDGSGSISLEAAFENATERLRLDLSLQEDAGGILARLADLPGRPSVDFSISGDAPLSDFTADIRLATEGVERLTGQVRLAETGEARQITADIGGDIAPVFAPEARGFFGDEIALEIEALSYPDGRVSIPALSLQTRELTLGGTVEIGADGLPDLIDLSGRIAPADGDAVDLPFAQDTRIGRAELAVRFDAAESEEWTGDIRLIDLVTGDIRAGTLALAGSGRIRPGTPPEVTATLDFDAAGLDMGAEANAALGQALSGRVAIDWNGGPVEIERIEVTGDALGLEGSARIDGPRISGQLAVDAERLADFSALAGRPLAGAARFETEFTANPLDGTFDVTASGTTQDLSIGEPRADAILAGRTQLDLTANRDETGLTVDLTRLESAAARLTGAAELRSGGSTLTLEGELADTGILLEGLDGPSTIALWGTENAARDWDVSLRIDGPALSANAQGKIVGLYDDTPSVSGRIEAEAPDLAPLSDLAGRPLAGSLQLTAEGGAALDLSRGLVDASVQGQALSVGQAELDRLLRGALDARLTASWTGKRVEIGDFALSTDLLTADASGTLTEDGGELAVQARLADLAPFAPDFPGPLSVEGTVSRADPGLGLDVSATGPGGSRATLSGTVAESFDSANLGIRGTAPLALANGFIAPRSLSGTAGFDLRLDGPLAPESLSGTVTTSGARLALPALLTALENISATIRLSNGRAETDLAGNVEAGGRLSVSGPISLAAPNNASLRVQLAQVRLSDPRLFETRIDGALDIEGPLTGGASISGDLRLGETTIRIPSTGLGGAGEIPEITHINEPPPVRGTRARAGLLGSGNGDGNGAGPAYPLDIRLSAPNRIFVRGRGLDAEFGGSLRITGTTNDVVPIGAFELIRGRLDILGRRLALQQARITIEGDFVPVLDIRATTQAEDTEVGVTVTGPADMPDINFTSSPELPQEEVLARLIFGRGLDTLSPLQAARLALAVRTLAGQGGEGIVGRIRGQTGLADLDVTTDAEGNTAVRAGAYLGENLYTDVTIDSAGETRLNLNLDLTPSVTARGGVSNDGETSVGIFLERDY